MRTSPELVVGCGAVLPSVLSSSELVCRSSITPSLTFLPSPSYFGMYLVSSFEGRSRMSSSVTAGNGSVPSTAGGDTVPLDRLVGLALSS
jgi:hypothetical protein